MQIFHLIPFLWSGAGDVLSRLAVSQAKKATVAVVTSGRSKGESDWESYRTRLQTAGVEHFEIDLFDRDPAVFWQSVSKLSDVCARFSPDVLHCHAGVPAAAAAVVRDRTARQFALIGTLHSWGKHRPAWMDTMDLWAFGRCDRVHCVSEDYRQILRNSGIPADRISSTPWGLDLEGIRAAAAEAAVRRSGSKQLGFVGRIEPRKGQLSLVESFDRLRQKGTDARLELIGPIADPGYARQIRVAIDTRNLNDRVVMRGEVSNVYSNVANWDLFVSLSSDEGQGMAVLEAMALGVPVVSSNISGVRDFLRHQENGLVVDPPTPERVSNTLSWALDHKEETQMLASRAKDMIDSRYRWETTVNSMEHLYSLVT